MVSFVSTHINTLDQMLLTMNLCLQRPMFRKGYCRCIIRAQQLLDCSLNATIATATIPMFLLAPVH
jgi:hypothetical protein